MRRADDLPEITDLLAKADEPAGKLNIGELRRLELARALAAEPRLPLLDEPAAGIGADGMRPLAGLIADTRARGVTILLVEHHVGFALSLCDRAVVLDAGRIIAQGAPEAVRADPAVVAAYRGRGSALAHSAAAPAASDPVGGLEM